MLTNSRDIKRRLEKEGWVLGRVTGSHHVFKHPQSADTVVLGVSTDTVESHQKFAEKFSLPFPLLADEDHAVAEKYGVWVEKNMYGKKSMGIQRSTFLIDAAGKVAKVWKKVSVDGHDEDVLAELKKLSAK